MLARPDNLLWLLVIAGYGVLRLRRRWAAAAFGGAGLLLYFALSSGSRNLGWRTLFHHSFIERLPYPESFTPSLSLWGYFSVYLRQGHPINLPSILVLIALIGGCVFAFRWRRFGSGDDGVALLTVSGVFTALHWAVYPGEDRFLAAVYLGVLILLVRTLVSEPPGPPSTGRVELAVGSEKAAANARTS
jgi:hypothetical protein